MAARRLGGELEQRLSVAWSATRRQVRFGLNVKGAIGVDTNGMTTDEAMIVAKTRAFALDYEVEEGEGDGWLGEGHPSPGLSQEPGHGTAVIEDDSVPDGDGEDEDVLEPLGREVVRRMLEKWRCKLEEGLGDFARGELARVRPLGLGGRALALAHGFLTCRPWQPHGAQWLESTGAAAQARHSGACRCARTCTTPGRQNPRREHAKMCVISTPVHSPRCVTDVQTACCVRRRAGRSGTKPARQGDGTRLLDGGACGAE